MVAELQRGIQKWEADWVTGFASCVPTTCIQEKFQTCSSRAPKIRVDMFGAFLHSCVGLVMVFALTRLSYVATTTFSTV